jgi:hypothetical protein
MIGAEKRDERALPGDRVKLTGGHRFAGYTAIYLADKEFPFGGKRPWVRLESGTCEECWVNDPETQMRKL